MAVKELTAEQHNEAVAAKVAQLREEIEELLKTIKPIDAAKEVDLVLCNASALADRQAQFEHKNVARAAFEAVINAPAKKK